MTSEETEDGGFDDLNVIGAAPDHYEDDDASEASERKHHLGFPRPNLVNGDSVDVNTAGRKTRNKDEAVKTDGKGTDAVLDDEKEDAEEQIKEKILKRIAGDKDFLRMPKRCFAHLFLYNSIRETGRAEKGIHGYMIIHGNLMTLHGFMAGFQYLVLDASQQGDTNDEIFRRLDTAIFTIRFLAFIMSLMGTLVSLIAQEYLKSLQYEELEFQVEGILKYSPFFLHSDRLAFLSSILQVTTTNLFAYNTAIPGWLCYRLNGISGAGVVFFLYYFGKIILGKQNYHHHGNKNTDEQKYILGRYIKTRIGTTNMLSRGVGG